MSLKNKEFCLYNFFILLGVHRIEEEALTNHTVTCLKMLRGMTKPKVKELAYPFAMQKNKKILGVGNKTRLQEKTGSKNLGREENKSRYDNVKLLALPVL